MKFTISQEAEINVYNNEGLFLKADVRSGINFHLRFFKEDKLILETSSIAFILFKKIWIKEQDLPHVIEFARQKGIWGFVMNFGEHIIRTSQKPLRNPAYLIYLDDQLVGQVHDHKGITVGRHYIFNTDTEDEVLNLYLIIAFVVQFIPL